LVHDEVDLLVRIGYELHVIAMVEAAFKQAFGEFYGDRYAVRMEHKWGQSWGKGTKYNPLKPETWPPAQIIPSPSSPAAAALTLLSVDNLNSISFLSRLIVRSPACPAN
jgi:hypothetical protein